LGVTVAKDLAVKSISSYSMNKGVWNIFNTLKDEMAQSKIEEDLRNMPPKAPQPDPTQKYEKVEVEDVDEQMRKMNETNARAMGQMDDDFDESEIVESGTNKFHINTHENPLREKRKKRDLSKNVKVKSTFQKGTPKV
jgi:hypothetical protein